MRFASLFSGIGGLDLGLERAGHQCVLQAETDPFCLKVLSRHWPDVVRYDEGIEELLGGCVPHEDFDMVAGGDPCQAHSVAATAHGTKARSLGGLYVEFIEKYRPRIVVRENPPARRDAEWTPERWGGALQDLGYRVTGIRLRACCAGTPCKRERVFLLATLSEPERSGLERYEREVVARENEGRPDPDLAGSDRWDATPRVCGSTPRVPHRMERLRALGNAVVPAVGEYIGRIIARIGAKPSS